MKYFQTQSVESPLHSQATPTSFRLLHDFPMETALTRGALKVCYQDGWS